MSTITKTVPELSTSSPPQADAARVLIVDDLEPNRVLLREMVKALGHEPLLAADGREALAALRAGVDLVLLDVSMPGMDGFEVAENIRTDPEHADLPIVMVTAQDSKSDRLRAAEAGANDFIAKPPDFTELRVRTASILKMKAAQDAIKRHRAELEVAVERRTADLQRALAELASAQRDTERAHLDTVHRLSLAAEHKDETTGCHIQRIGRYCGILARGLGLPASEVELIRHASPMHDVGKIGIPDGILLKPGRLTPEEWETMKQHTVIGARMLQSSPSPILRAGRVIALSHHERWDGAGYPHGLAGTDIPLWARICAVADVFDAITNARPYKPALSNEEAYAELRKGSGRHFDPQVVEVFFRVLDETLTVQREFPAPAPGTGGDDGGS